MNTGSCGDFCSGADLSEGADRETAGAGCNLALGCDLIVASERARFSEIFAQRGLSLDCGGSWLLPRLVGMHKAKELALLAEVISAQEAERIGIVNRVVPTEDLDAFVDDWAVRLAQGAPLALKMTKCMLTDALSYSLNEALDAEAMAQTVNFGADDAREASGLSGQARAGLSGALSGSRDRWHAAPDLRGAGPS